MRHDYPSGPWPGNAGRSPNCEPDFERRFLRSLLRRLDDAGFEIIAHAVLAAALEVDQGRNDREELDALVDLGIEVLARRHFPIALRPVPPAWAVEERTRGRVSRA